MRALIINRQLTPDEYSSVYEDIQIPDESTEQETASKAYIKYGKDIIFLIGKDRPLYINIKVGLVSPNTTRWVQLIVCLHSAYPSLRFKHDKHFSNIQTI